MVFWRFGKLALGAAAVWGQTGNGPPGDRAADQETADRSWLQVVANPQVMQKSKKQVVFLSEEILSPAQINIK